MKGVKRLAQSIWQQTIEQMVFFAFFSSRQKADLKPLQKHGPVGCFCLPKPDFLSRSRGRNRWVSREMAER
jgi:hypothetical protein